MRLNQFCDSRASCRQAPSTHGETGLTLIEMMIVLTIIGIVAGAIVFSGILNRPDEARVTTTRSSLSTISGALKMYRLDNGNYPTTEQGLKALAEKPVSEPVPQSWAQGGYLPQPPVDSWGHPFVYAATPDGFDIKSLGRDGKPGGEGVDADIDLKG